MSSGVEPFVEISGEALSEFFRKFQEDEAKFLPLKALAEVHKSTEVPEMIRRKLFAHRDPDIGILFSCIKYPSSLPLVNILKGNLPVQNIQLYCHSSNLQQLETALERTEVLDYDCYTIYNHIDSDVIPVMEKVAKTKCGAIRNWGPAYNVTISPEKALGNRHRLKCPDEVYIRSLTKEEALLPYKSWRYHFSQTYDYFQSQVPALPSVGVFLKENHKLIAWMLISDLGSLGYFYTSKDYRGKGYGKLVLNALSVAAAEKSITPTATVESYNDASLSCFKALGYEVFKEASLLVFIPDSFPLGVEEFQRIITSRQEEY